SRPMSTRMRWYSSALSPCAATSAGEIFARLVLRAFGLRAGRVLRARAGRFVVVLAIAGRGEPHLCRLLEVIGKPGKQAASVGRPEHRVHVVSGCGIRPSTLPLSLSTPAMALVAPLTFQAGSSAPSGAT